MQSLQFRLLFVFECLERMLGFAVVMDGRMNFFFPTWNSVAIWTQTAAAMQLVAGVSYFFQKYLYNASCIKIYKTAFTYATMKILKVRNEFDTSCVPGLTYKCRCENHLQKIKAKNFNKESWGSKRRQTSLPIHMR